MRVRWTPPYRRHMYVNSNKFLVVVKLLTLLSMKLYDFHHYLHYVAIQGE